MPAERHTHYDTHGNPTGYTLVERESRVDDADRLDILALLRHDAEVCSCGYHPSIARDPDNNWQPETQKCPVCAGQAVWQRVLGEDDKGVPQDAPPMRPRPSDGRHSYMRMLTPEQASAAQAKASPEPT